MYIRNIIINRKMNTKVISKIFLLIFFNGYILSFNTFALPGIAYEQQRYRMYELGNSINGINNSLRNIDRRMQEQQMQREYDKMMNSLNSQYRVEPVKLQPFEPIRHNGLNPLAAEFYSIQESRDKNLEEFRDAFLDSFFK